MGGRPPSNLRVQVVWQAGVPGFAAYIGEASNMDITRKSGELPPFLCPAKLPKHFSLAVAVVYDFPEC